MRTNTLARRLAGGALVFAAATAAAIGAASTAAAAPAGDLGTLTVSQQSGLDIQAPSYTTSAPCPSSAEQVQLFVYGPGAWAGGFIGTTPTDVGFSTSGPITVVQGLSFKDIAVDNSVTIVPGTYTVAVQCVDGFGDLKGNFTRDIEFTSATQWNVPTVKANTTTGLSAAPVGPITAGSSVTFTASVSPAAATGNVEFRDGATVLGTAAISGGQAVFSTSALAQGARSITAAYLGDPAHNGSVSPALTYQVNAPAAVATTTGLSVSPVGTAQAFSTVTFNASVTPAAAAGVFQFFDGANALGNPVAAAGGTATFNSATLAVGAHAFTVRFTPTNPAAFVASTSPVVNYDITAFAGVSDYEDITTTVLAGELTISVANKNVTLPSPVQTADGSLLTTAGSLNPIKVTDTRAGNPGWNVSGQVTDFINGANSINGANLGWTPKIVDKSPVQNIAAGPVVNPANALVPGVSAPAGLGLASARVLATAAALGGNGTANLTADLALNVPTSTVAGTYTARLTLTAI